MTSSITIRMDAELKKQAETLFEDMGMNMTTAFTIFTKAAVRQCKIPFEIEGDPFYNEANQKRLREAMKRMEKTGGTVHELIEADND
jgi:DNA-damage-inducible protein J